MKLIIILSLVVIVALLLLFKVFEKETMKDERITPKTMIPEPVDVTPEIVLSSSGKSVEEEKYEVILSMAKIPGVADDQMNSKMKNLANEILNKEVEFPFSDDMRNPKFDGELRGIMAGLLQFEVFQLGSTLLEEIERECKNQERPTMIRQSLTIEFSKWLRDNEDKVVHLTELGELEEELGHQPLS